MTEVVTEAVGEELNIPEIESNVDVNVNEESDQNVVANPEDPRSVPDPILKSSKESLGNRNNPDINSNENNSEDEKKAPEEGAVRSSSPIQDVEMEQTPEETLKESSSIEEYYKMVKSLLSADPAALPASYTKNSEKEEKVIDFVENFLRQYKQLFPNRKELFILPNNEWNVKKFVCSTIKPTLLKFKELYDYRDCARFVADYLSYEYLDPPYEIPKQLPSPTFTLQVQGGNSFDYSILLCSLLRGAGYDAYVVSGYATKTVTLMDDSRLYSSIKEDASPFILGALADEVFDNHEDSPESNSSKAGDTNTQSQCKYKLKAIRVLSSSFIQRQEDKKRKEQELQEQEKLSKLEMEKKRQRELKEQDDLKGLRVHAWVLILPGKREIAEAMFLEPSTGKIYSTDDPHFLGVESVFSNYNYWVNMQVCYDGLKGISFDLSDISRWELLFVENGHANLIAGLQDNTGDGEAEEDEEDENAYADASNVDLPPSWVSNITLTQEQFEKRCPMGRKVTLYQNCITETFAEYNRKDGMVYRVTLFSDDERKDKTEVQEYFSKRQDKLVRRIRYLKKSEIHELFERGRPHALRQQIIVQSKMKEMHFYSSARHDGLVRREELPHKSMEFFIGRDDGLVYRSSTYENSENQNSYGTIIKMTEKFSRNSESALGEDIDKVTYFLKDDKIRVIFHLPDSRIIPCVQEFRKPGSDQKSNLSDLISHYDPDVFSVQPKKQYLYAKMLNFMKREQTCLMSVKNAEKEVQDIIQSRNAEEKDIHLSISVYDTIRNNTTINEETTEGGVEQTKRVKDENETNPLSSKSDYLSPFLVNFPTDPSLLTRDDAIAIKDACLKSLKERIIEKANIIQKRLDEETTSLQKAQASFQKDQDTLSLEETESYMQYCQEAMFRIQILEKRLAKHKEQAPEKYVSLDKKIRADARIGKLLQ